jgi:CheY-like chemotaxis protein
MSKCLAELDMPNASARILIVDDEPSIRLSLSHALAEIGYRTRSAEDGFTALHEIRQQMPDILVSDLNMPGMSGFELLSVVRRRFPSIHAIAMSGAFSGDEVPSGIAADAFYQKGSSMGALLRIMGTPPDMARRAARRSGATDPIWIQRNGQNAWGEGYITIACPECLRTFPQATGSSTCQFHDTICIYCRSSIHYAIVEPLERQPLQVLRTDPAEGTAMHENTAQFYY